MVELIPAINAETFEEVEQKIKIIEPYAADYDVSWIHLDVADGTFTPNTVWHNAEDLLGLKTRLNIEVHLMISDIDTRVEEWLIRPVKRIIFHLEAGHDPFFVIDKIKSAGKEAVIAFIIPRSDWRLTQAFFREADAILALGVHPGTAGQNMDSKTFKVTSELRKACRRCIIEVDGGVNVRNAASLVQAGASRLVSASAIFNSKQNSREAIEQLKREVIKNA